MKTELIVLNDIDQFEKMKGKLLNAGIPHTTKIKNRDSNNFLFGGSSRNRMANPIKDVSNNKLYYIYVEKKDYEQAKYVINQ